MLANAVRRACTVQPATRQRKVTRRACHPISRKILQDREALARSGVAVAIAFPQRTLVMEIHYAQ